MIRVIRTLMLLVVALALVKWTASGAVGPGGLAKTVNVNAGMSLLSPAITNAAPGTRVFIAAGSFPVTNFWGAHGVIYEGQGMGATTLWGTPDSACTVVPGSATFRNMTIVATNVTTYCFPVGRLASAHPYCTNALFENVEIIGSTDGLFYQVDDPAHRASVEFRNCRFITSFDSVIHQGTTNGGATFVNTDFIVDVARFPCAINTGAEARWIDVNPIYPGSNLRFRNCTVQVLNSPNPRLIEEHDIPDTAGTAVYLEMNNVAMQLFPTNSALSINYPYRSDDMKFTNFVSMWANVSPVEIPAGAAIWTNGLGPAIHLMTSTAVRTNWLPIISRNGQTNNTGLEITVKDSAGNAGTANISVRALGGATIDGSAVFTMNANYQTAKFRTLGTNWTRIGN